MPDMRKDKIPVREQDAEARSKNWGEVCLGYTAEEAVAEAARCLNCKNPACVSGCPVGVKIPDFIAEIVKGDFDKGLEIIKDTNFFPAICGRVCPQENQCEGKCVRGIKCEPVAIGRLERFLADNGHDDRADKTVKNGHKVAVIGSGPAGLACAGALAKKGYSVTLFEALHTPGGVLVYGIPEFRLPKSIVKKEIDALKKLGVEIMTDMVIGRVLSVDELFDMKYEAVFVGSGAGLPGFLGIEGENLKDVFSANEYLTRINLMKAYRDDYDTPVKISKKVAVVGGGNVAMDAARCARRLGAEVSIVYRRSEVEMPARAEEVHHAKEEGIILNTLTNPVRINGDEKGNVVSMTCRRMELGEPDEKGRRRPVEIEGSDFDIEIDTAIIAIGTSPNPLIRMTTPGLDTDRRGCFITEEGAKTTREGVFAGGDAVTGAATVILAMGAGKSAADEIDEYIKKKK